MIDLGSTPRESESLQICQGGQQFPADPKGASVRLLMNSSIMLALRALQVEGDMLLVRVCIEPHAHLGVDFS